jgi:hypothetical protein
MALSVDMITASTPANARGATFVVLVILAAHRSVLSGGG